MYCIRENPDHEYETVDLIVGNCRKELQKVTAPVKEIAKQLCMVHDKVKK